MKIKLVVAPYYFYNAFMPPLGIGIVSAALTKYGIKHEIDDLYVKLYHALKNNLIDINVFLDPGSVRGFINNGSCGKVRSETEKIIRLTDFKGYDYICFSGHYPPLDLINSQTIIACLIKLIKEIYNPLIVTNFRLDNFKGAQLIDLYTEDINLFIKFLKIKKNNSGRATRHIFLRPDFKRLPLRMYDYSTKTQVSEFVSPALKRCDLARFSVFLKSKVRLLPYMFIDGCQGRCIFCEFSGNAGLVIKEFDIVIRDLKALSRTCNTNEFMFLNSNINPSRKTAIDFAEKVIKSKIKIRFTDCANFNNLDKEVLIKLKEAGAVRLVLGLESASPKIQGYIGKIIGPGHASEVLKICYELGIWTEVDLLVGLPHESAGDIIATLDFIKENAKYIRNINLNRFILKQESLIYRNPGKHKIADIRPDPRYNYGYDEIGGLEWEPKKRIMEYRYARFLECLHPDKVNYFRPAQFIFILNRHFNNAKNMNYFLDNIFFFQDRNDKIKGFIKELKNGDDIIKADRWSV